MPLKMSTKLTKSKVKN